jgi:hypothetical protein
MGNIGDVLLAIQAASMGGRAVMGAVEGVREQESGDRMIQAARNSLASMGHPEAAQVADLLYEDPNAANQYVMTRYGGWDDMYTHLHKQLEESAAASAIREAGGEADVPDYIRRRREYAAGVAEAGQTASAGQMMALFPGPPSPQSLGLNPEQWTGESMNEVMQSAALTGIPDYTPLEARPTPMGGVPDNVKLPTGWMWDASQVPHARPIPGTNAEQDFLLGKIMKHMWDEGLSFEEYWKKYPEKKAFFDAQLRRISKDNPFLGRLLEMADRGGSGAPVPGTGAPASLPPSGRSNLGD